MRQPSTPTLYKPSLPRVRGKCPEKKYRRFTGRRGAPNTGKVIETAKKKNERRTGEQQERKQENGQIDRAIAPVSGGWNRGLLQSRVSFPLPSERRNHARECPARSTVVTRG